MTSTRSFATDTGEIFTSATKREFIVVVTDTGEIIRRTDDVRIARKVAANTRTRVVARRVLAEGEHRWSMFCGCATCKANG